MTEGLLITLKLYAIAWISAVKQSLSQLRWQLPLLKGAYTKTLLLLKGAYTKTPLFTQGSLYKNASLVQREVARLCRDGGIVINFKLSATTYIGAVKQSLSQLRWQLPLLKGAYIKTLLLLKEICINSLLQTLLSLKGACIKKCLPCAKGGGSALPWRRGC